MSVSNRGDRKLMNCWQMRMLISEYFDDELSDEEKRAVENHIVFCGPCYKEFVEMRALVGKLKLALAPYRFTAQDKEALLDKLPGTDSYGQGEAG